MKNSVNNSTSRINPNIKVNDFSHVSPEEEFRNILLELKNANLRMGKTGMSFTVTGEDDHIGQRLSELNSIIGDAKTAQIICEVSGVDVPVGVYADIEAEHHHDYENDESEDETDEFEDCEDEYEDELENDEYENDEINDESSEFKYVTELPRIPTAEPFYYHGHKIRVIYKWDAAGREFADLLIDDGYVGNTEYNLSRIGIWNDAMNAVRRYIG